MWTSDGVLFAVQHTIRGIAKTWLDAQQVYRSFKSVVEL